MVAPYHLCFAVPDLDATIADLSRIADVAWHEPRAGRLGEWDYRIVFSRDDPAIEVIQGPQGSPWYAEAARFDHLGWWSTDLESTSRRLEEDGHPVDFDACPLGRSFVYHRVDSLGARVELVDVLSRAGLHATWDGLGPPRDPLTH